MLDRIVKGVMNGIGFIPIAWMGVLYVFTALCWLKLGHFPIPSLDDPKYIGFSFLYYLSVLGMIITLPVILLWILLLPIAVQRKLLSKKKVVIMLTGSTIAILQLFVDPFSLIYWLLD